MEVKDIPVEDYEINHDKPKKLRISHKRGFILLKETFF